MEIENRLKDLYNKSYKQNTYEFTEFLAMTDLSAIYNVKDIVSSWYTVHGGYEGAERCMIRFGNKDEFGYEESFPIVCLKIEPLIVKFADNLTHRDFLGALMNLGIKREVLGDIIVTGSQKNDPDKKYEAYLFCQDSIAEYIISSLDKVKHTSVKVSYQEELPEVAVKQPETVTVQSASERLDGIVAGMYKLSRSVSQELFRAQKIFVNGRLMENVSHTLKPDDMVTVRGFGKFQYLGISGQSKKGRYYIQALKY